MSTETVTIERAEALAMLRADPAFQEAPANLQEWLLFVALGHDAGEAEQVEVLL